MINKTNRKYILEYNQLLKECDNIYHDAAIRAGLSDCAFWILHALWEADHVFTQSEIGDNASMPRQTVNSALKKLEKDGYLVLEKIDGKMGKSIRLTEAGERFAQTHIAPIAAAEERVCAQFTQQEQEEFLTTFRTLVNRLRKEITEGI